MGKKSALPVIENTSTTIIPKSVSPEEFNKVKKLKIFICCPGDHVSMTVLSCFMNLYEWARGTNIQFKFVTVQGSNISHVREMLLMGDINGTNRHQKPFQGEDYDFVLFIDSDQTFTPNDVHLLLSANKDVIAGAIKMKDGNFAPGWYDELLFAAHGVTYRMQEHFLNSVNEPIKITLVGCGFTLIKKGVIEKLDFPWFKPIDYPQPRVGYMGEDMSFFTRLSREGVEFFLHPKVRIGHLKEIELK